MPPRLYLIRHGETEWSLSGRHTGRTDIPLTEQGEQDARQLGKRLRALSMTRVFASPRQRAQRTAALVVLTPVAEIEPDLAEWDYGDYEGRLSVEIRKGRPDWNLFRDGCPRGEMPEQVSDRADRLIARLRALDGNVALFSHGHFGCVLAVRWIGLPVIDGQKFELGTASLSVLGYEPNYPEKPVIALWNSSTSGQSRSRLAQGEKSMSCCSDVMKPIEASSCCTPQDTAAHAAKAMRTSGCGCAPVVQDTKHLKLVGVVTERDVCCSVAADDRRASEVRVEEIMRPAAACCGEGESLNGARRKLHEHRATSLPVVDGAGGCCGTVSAHHLEKA